MGRLIRTLLRLRPADAVTIIFLIFFIVLSLLFNKNIPKAPFLIVLYITLLFNQIAIIKI